MTRDEAINWAGDVTALAKQLNMTTQAVYDWGETVPRGRQFELVVLSNGLLGLDEKYLSKVA